jgi:acyl-CoA dehydrogenase
MSSASWRAASSYEEKTMPDMSPGMTKPAHGAHHIAPDIHGQNFYAIDRQFQDLLALYLEPGLRATMTPHFERLGGLAGNRLDELAQIADKHPPVLQPRDRFGRDEDWIDYHPAYREMEKVAFEEFGMHAMSHRAGVLGLKAPAHPLVKYGITYLFVQAEFGLMCPVSVSDTSNFIIKRYGSEPLKKLLLDRLLSQDPAVMLKGTQFMTEKAGGSDVGAIESEAERLGVGADGVERWKLYGQKWFCSHADADVVVLLARPRGAAPGTQGLAMFAMPRRLEDGARNAYRIVRLKDKLGTRSMASGEIILEGATAYLVGDAQRGFKQMMDQVNLSRLSHGVRAAAMMRRCLNEALAAARGRRAFGRTIAEYPLLRRQLMKIMLPTEQALSMYAFSADAMGRADNGDRDAANLLRILTPVYKFRACRDNIPVASAALEVRGGIGYIEEWVTARLVRDAQIGTLWEGTSNINALDVVQRAVGKSGGHKTLATALKAKYAPSASLPGQYKGLLGATLDRVEHFAEAVAADPRQEKRARLAAGALYHAASAALMAWEGATLGAQGGDARRVLLSRLVIEHRLAPQDPLSLNEAPWEQEAIDLLLADAPVPLAKATALLS